MDTINSNKIDMINNLLNLEDDKIKKNNIYVKKYAAIKKIEK